MRKVDKKQERNEKNKHARSKDKRKLCFEAVENVIWRRKLLSCVFWSEKSKKLL